MRLLEFCIKFHDQIPVHCKHPFIFSGQQYKEIYCIFIFSISGQIMIQTAVTAVRIIDEIISD
jgi:hypothetical protein